jgi:cytochrome b6-f complex iron-sulfur subunit
MSKNHLNRREFFTYLNMGFIFLGGAVTGLTSLVLRYLYPNVLFEPAQDFMAGTVDDYPEGVDERWKEILTA